MAQYSSAMELALKDPSKASSLEASFTNWQQVALVAQQAVGYATVDPQKAEDLLKEASSQLDDINDTTGRFKATVVVVQSAVTLKEKTIASKTLADGLDLGTELCDEELASRVNIPVYDTKTFNGLEQLTVSGALFDPSDTIDRLRNITNIALRADLLGDAAQIIFSDNKVNH